MNDFTPNVWTWFEAVNNGLMLLLLLLFIFKDLICLHYVWLAWPCWESVTIPVYIPFSCVSRFWAWSHQASHWEWVYRGRVMGMCTTLGPRDQEWEALPSNNVKMSMTLNVPDPLTYLNVCSCNCMKQSEMVNPEMCNNLKYEIWKLGEKT